MKISDKYSNKKLYTGIRYHNGLPVSAEDLHQYEDIIYNKNRLVYKNILSNGVIETPLLSINTGSNFMSILVNELPLNISGDIVYISNINETTNSSYSVTSSGQLYLFGWYEELNTSSDITEYGGMFNKLTTNDILDDYSHVQTTTKYQFRWGMKCTTVTDETIVVQVPKQGHVTSATDKTVYFSNLEGSNGYYVLKNASTVLGTSLPFVVEDTMYLIKLADVVATSSSITSITPIDPPDSRMLPITDREIDTIFES